ncbi:MAG: hypothetical protein V7707_14780 [Motiliproteus sp.]
MPQYNTATITVSLMIILIIALLVNYYFHQLQERKRQRALLARKIKSETEKILEALTTLNQLQCPAAVIKLFNDEVVKAITKLNNLNPEVDMIEQIESQNRVAGNPTESLNLENDRSMKQAHVAIRFAIRFVHKRRSVGELSSILCDEYSAQLQWLDSKIEIDTHIGAGKRMLENDKPAVAISRFKHAKSVIAHLPPRDPRRQDLVDEINQLIAQALPFSTNEMKQGN